MDTISTDYRNAGEALSRKNDERTGTAQSLIPILDELCDWGSEHLGDEIEFRCDEE